MNADTFNSRYPVGTPVFAYPGARPEDIPSARRIVTRTRTEAKTVGLDRDGVVWVEGHGAYISLTHVDPVSEGEWQAARDADAALVAARQPKDSLAPWLANRYGHVLDWTLLPDADRSYWEHEAAAVRRAVARGGFREPMPAGPHVDVDADATGTKLTFYSAEAGGQP